MNTVWIITEYDNREIIAVYSSREKALASDYLSDFADKYTELPDDELILQLDDDEDCIYSLSKYQLF